MAKVIYSWEDIARLTRTLVVQLRGQRFDALLAITRGGMIPGCLISEWLDIRNVMTAAVMFYTAIETRMDVPRFLQVPSDALLVDKRILIVDDVWDSGKTAVAVSERVRAAGGVPTVAVIDFKPTANRFPGHRPDVFAQETDAWVVYPWEPAEEEAE